jgi:drug/metabolite transporter (DMT)-like permease
MVVIVPAWLAIGFFASRYQIKSDVFLVWYFGGTIIGTLLLGGVLKNPQVFFPSPKGVAAMLAVGVGLGTIANVFLYKAIAIAPNPGLPIAVVNAASVLVFLASLALARLLPRDFSATKFDLWHLCGIALTLVGIVIISGRR